MSVQPPAPAALGLLAAAAEDEDFPSIIEMAARLGYTELRLDAALADNAMLRNWVISSNQKITLLRDENQALRAVMRGRRIQLAHDPEPDPGPAPGPEVKPALPLGALRFGTLR